MGDGGSTRLFGGGSNGGYSSDHLTHFLQNPLPSSSSSSQVFESLWVSNSSPSFHEPSTINFSGAQRRHLEVQQFHPATENDEEDRGGVGSGGEDYGSETEGMRNPYRQPEKKRRLTAEQVQYLERSFETENKLEPQRKIHLAKQLGLQPRQVAIWFQNRRARFKTKQLEKEYDSLKSNYDSLKADYDSLLKEKDRLQNEVSFLTNKLKLRERGESDSELQTGSINSIHLDRLEPQGDKAVVAVAPCKQEDASSVKSDVVDSKSPHCTEGNYAPGLEMANSERSDFLQDEGEDLSGGFRPVAGVGYGFDGDLHGSCNFGLMGVEQSSYWPWLY